MAEEQEETNRKVWMHPWVLRRQTQGIHHNLFLELMLENPNRFRRCVRLDTAPFEELVQKVAPLTRKKDTHLRQNIPPAECLPLTLRHLATGETQHSLSLAFRIGQSTISGIIKEVCKAIIDVVKGQHIFNSHLLKLNGKLSLKIIRIYGILKTVWEQWTGNMFGLTLPLDLASILLPYNIVRKLFVV